MNSLFRDFISNEARDFKFKIGKTMASSLAGFVIGVVFASIFWVTILYIRLNY